VRFSQIAVTPALFGQLTNPHRQECLCYKNQ
jgi:hypothetical protein